jgi:hypothetical protein
LTAVPRDVHGPEEEHMTVIHLPLATAVAMVVSGEIIDAKTALALLLTERLLSERLLTEQLVTERGLNVGPAGEAPLVAPR